MNNRIVRIMFLPAVLVAGLPSAQAQFAQSIAPLVMAQASPADKGASRAVVDDREIALRVQSAIFKDKRVSGLGLGVKATDGTVELSGRADSQSQADRAVAIARAVPGVKAVTSEIRVN
jgi:hyperosmotically inducible protein